MGYVLRVGVRNLDGAEWLTASSPADPYHIRVCLGDIAPTYSFALGFPCLPEKKVARREARGLIRDKDERLRTTTEGFNLTRICTITYLGFASYSTDYGVLSHSAATRKGTFH
jgi:hypothetical protein